MDELKIISIDNNVITLQHTYTINIDNIHDLFKAYYSNYLDVMEFKIIKEKLYPSLTSDQYNELANQVIKELDEEDY